MGYVDKEGVMSSIDCNNYPCLVLNADYQPLSYLPLSLWPWQDAVKAVFLDRVNVVDNYNKVIRSANYKMMAPSVVSLKDYVSQDRAPAFTKFNLFLRDGFKCVYCSNTEELTFDHLIPRRLGGKTSWENIVAACTRCNFKKGGRLPERGWDGSKIKTFPAFHSSATSKRKKVSA